MYATLATVLMLTWLVVAGQAATPLCGGPLARSTPLEQVSRNMVLTRHVLTSYAKKSSLVCVAACLRHGLCVSVNYEGSTGVCELNASSKDDFPGDVEMKDGWKYYGTLPGTATARELCPTTTTTQPPRTTLETTTPSTLPTTAELTTTPQRTTPQQTTPPTTAFVTTEKPPVDCWDIHNASPDLESGEYTVFPETRSGPLQVYCDMVTDGGGWTVIQRRIDNTQDFYLEWASYKVGFGHLADNFWLGNDALNELTTQQNYQLRIELQSYGGTSTYTKYGLFVVDTEANKYRLTLGTFYGSYIADDALTLHDGQAFSTRDQDNDSDGERHCAVTFLGAWWYNACFSSNLNGPYSTTESVSQLGQGIIWGTWKTVSKSLKRAEMKIRPASAHTVAKDCWDHYMQGVTASGSYSIQVTGLSEPMQVYCDMEDAGGGWTVIQRRLDGSVDFYLDWADYKAGFGDLNGEFWLGNDNLHLLTNQDSYQLTVRLRSWDGITNYANYEEFSIADEADLYRLSVGGFTGSSNIGDSMAYHDGMAWSTRDRENDLDDDRHCAVKEIGAWWYNACEASNLNGPYVPSPGTLPLANSGEGIMWGTWRGQTYSYQKAEMKVRPAHVGFAS